MPGDRGSFQIQVNSVGTWDVPEALLLQGCRAVLHAEGILEGELSVTLLDDAGILDLNRKYFGKDWPTDVIAFALHAPGDPILGDVYLGFDQACRQADELGIPLEEELLRLAIHGTLHVLGHRHPEGDERAGSEMYQKQEALLQGILELPLD